MDLWIADDLIRRISVTVDDGPGSDGEPSLKAISIDFYDFGADIEIAPPS